MDVSAESSCSSLPRVPVIQRLTVDLMLWSFDENCFSENSCSSNWLIKGCEFVTCASMQELAIRVLTWMDVTIFA